MTDQQQSRTRGWVYLALIAVVFAITLVLPESECRLVASGRLTDDCISHVSNSGQVAAMFAAVYAVIDPRAFVAVFGRLIRALIRVWAKATGRAVVELEPDRSKRSVSTPPLPQRTARRRPIVQPIFRWVASRFSIFAQAISPPAVVVAIVALALSALVLLPRIEQSERVSLEAILPAAPAPQGQPMASEGAPRTAVPSSYAIASGDTCISIATRFCAASRWREFAEHNSIRVFQRARVELCDLQPGAVYETPPSWRDPGCR